ncbi:Zn(II)2Cys6 transcription factor domain-containing protein [Aspergillus tubingensis]|uniref:Zn(II)2Cys6 transcription factor domain-containing protein n=1 Tax=Aspergillus tubingensis TaxID=5068 RepID=UPI001578C98B|nr:uncharacterized protein AtWU_09509 [Aspergillus tubingensis]GFN19704.1 hypothetical protein AtWU_09509 [Aspergillus tubingensis]
MFGTLSQNHSTQASYIVQVTDPPFQTDRNARTPHLACMACRTKKLKCSGEKTGCQRCQMKNLSCVFPDQSASRSARKQRSKRSQSAVSDTSHHPTNSSASGRQGSPEPRNQEVQGPSHIHVGEEEMDGDVFLDLPDFYDTGLSSTPDAEDISRLEAPLGLNTGLPTGSLSTSLEDALSHGSLLDISQDRHKPNYPGLPACIDLDTDILPVFSNPGVERASTSPSNQCHCPSQALALYERTQILYNRLDATPRSTINSHDTRDTLHRSKEIIYQCENLTECALCRTQSHIAMILLSVSHQLIICLKRQCATTNHHRLTDWHPNDAYPGQGTGFTHRSSLESATQRPPMTFHHSLESEDLEDEIQVLKTLLTLRMQATAKLLAKLQNIIDVGGWREHRELLDRVSALHQAAAVSIHRMGGRER